MLGLSVGDFRASRFNVAAYTDDQIEALIPEVEADYLKIRNKALELDDDDATVYPGGYKLAVIRMIRFLLDEANRDTSLSSENVDGRSGVGEFRTQYGYPVKIIAGIKRFHGKTI